MRLSPGTRLGPYEIRELVGSGGMGDVYRARDTRLGRDVAVKVLSSLAAADRHQLNRFLQEARAASLVNHPNILSVYDVGRSEGIAFIVSELLEGETLRHRLKRGALPLESAVAYMAQVADGLSAAHQRGIIHRDLKPENLFVTAAGTAKILDFGLTKLTAPARPSDETITPTGPGMVVGTVGYASPEQITDRPIDHRTDIFSLGVVLYEALSGSAPFQRDSPPQTLSAVIEDEPPALSNTRPDVPPDVEYVIRNCLGKDPARRFQCAADLALSLRTAQQVVSSPPRPARPGAPRKLAVPAAWAVGFLVALVALAVSFLASLFVDAGEGPSYRRIAFGRGSIASGRFTPDGSRVVYAASLNGHSLELLTTVPGTPESRALGVPGAEILAMSSSGHLAISLNRRIVRGFVGTGTLATVQEGQAPRELLRDVHWADWAPGGSSLAVIREIEGRTRLEFPVDRVLFETSGWISDPRFAPDGRLIAFIEHPVNADDQGALMVTDRAGRTRTLSRWSSILGLAWQPSGEELWFTAADDSGSRALRASDLSGRSRVIERVPGRLRLLDISRDGRALVTRDDLRIEAFGLRPNETAERNLSWLDWSLARDISADGTRLLITETGEAAGSELEVYLRRMDGSPAIHLGSGSGMALSPDGQQVLAISNARLVLLPVGPGSTLTLPGDGIRYHPWAGFFPSGRRIVFTGTESDRATRVYVQDIPAGRPVPISPEGFRVSSPEAVSPDARSVVAIGNEERLYLCSTSGGAPQPLAGSIPGEVASRWDADGRSVFVFREAELPARVYRLWLDGRREPWRTVAPAEIAGAIAIHRLVITPAGDGYAYTLERQLSDLYIASGFRQRARWTIW
jgi:eukaryotic-like serine/threonine-protein kinase